MSNDFEFEFEDYDPLEAKPITKKSMVIFFVIDTSESMKGKKIDDLNRIMREIIPQLAGVGGCNTELKYAVLSFSLHTSLSRHDISAHEAHHREK